MNLPPQALLMLKIALGVYLLVMFGLSLAANRKVKTEEDFLVAGRKLGLFLCWGALIATWFAAETMLATAQAARDEGVRGTLLEPWACGAALVIAGLFFAKPLWEMKLLTSGDFYRIKYGPRTESVVCLIQATSYFGWIAAQFVALAEIQQYYFGIPRETGIVIAAIITLSFTLTGGMWSVTITDTAQIILAFVGLIFLANTVFEDFGGSFLGGVTRLLQETDPDRLTLLPQKEIGAALVWTGVLASGLFGNLPGQELQQKIFSARSPQVARWSCILAGLVYILFGLIPLSLGLISAVAFPEESKKAALILMADKFLSPTMVIVFVMSFISIVISTSTSAVLAAGTIFGHNLLRGMRGFGSQGLMKERICILLVTGGGVWMAFSGQKIMALLEMSLSISLVAAFFPLVAGLWGKPKGELSGILSSLMGLSYFVLRHISEALVVGESDFEYSELVRMLAGPSQLGPGIGHVAYAMALVPADLYGLGGSIIGYFIGQWLSVDRPQESAKVEFLIDEIPVN